MLGGEPAAPVGARGAGNGAVLLPPAGVQAEIAAGPIMDSRHRHLRIHRCAGMSAANAVGAAVSAAATAKAGPAATRAKPGRKIFIVSSTGFESRWTLVARRPKFFR